MSNLNSKGPAGSFEPARSGVKRTLMAAPGRPSHSVVYPITGPGTQRGDNKAFSCTCIVRAFIKIAGSCQREVSRTHYRQPTREIRFSTMVRRTRECNDTRLQYVRRPRYTVERVKQHDVLMQMSLKNN